MYVDGIVKLPNAPGKIVHQKKGENKYVYYETDRTYDPSEAVAFGLRLGAVFRFGGLLYHDGK